VAREIAEEKSLRLRTLVGLDANAKRPCRSRPISEVRSVLFYDEQARLQLGRERASELAEEYRRSQRLPRRSPPRAGGRSLAWRAPAYRA
jgi:hypothetical protein